MKIPVFFASFFCILIGISVHSFAAINQVGECIPSSHNITMPESASFLKALSDQDSISSAGLPEEIKALICDDVEDESQDDSTSRKYKSADYLYSTAYFHAFLDTRHSCTPALPAIWRHTSHIYIFQRTLRI